MMLARRKPLVSRPGPEPTPEEALRIVDAKLGPCIPCMVWAALGNMPAADVFIGGDYHHVKSGNLRRGHRHGFCNCTWHHRGVVPDRWTHQRMRLHYGPSLMDGSAQFHDTYGSDEELIDAQDKVLVLMANGYVHKGQRDHG